MLDSCSESLSVIVQQSPVYMQIGWGGQNHAVDLLRLKHRRQVREHRHIVKSRTARLDNSSQDGIRRMGDRSNMTPPNKASTNESEFDGVRHHDSTFRSSKR